MISRITAVIRTYNSERTLDKCLRLLKNQNVPLELLVVDSGSTDSTLEIASRSEAKIVHYPKGEAFDYSRALNLGCREANGEFIFYCSSHVWLSHHNAVEALMEEMQKTDSFAGYISRRGLDATIFSDQPDPEFGEVKTETYNIFDFDRLQGIGFFSNHASLIPRKLIEKRGFVEGMPCAEDLEWAKYWMENTGQTIVRLIQPYAVYANPYETEKKKSRERIFVYQTFFSNHSWVTRSRGCLGRSWYYLRKGKWRDTAYSMREVFMYPICRYRPFRFQSKYY